MEWKKLWMDIFGTTEWLGLNMGFWVAMAAVIILVIIMNAVLWGMKPKDKDEKKDRKTDSERAKKLE